MGGGVSVCQRQLMSNVRFGPCALRSGPRYERAERAAFLCMVLVYGEPYRVSIVGMRFIGSRRSRVKCAASSQPTHF